MGLQIKVAAGWYNQTIARLVARGFSQIQSIDYFETFSPMVRYESVKTMLAVVAKHNMKLMQFDVKTAFLNSSLKEDIYMQQPEGYEDGSNCVCHLKKGHLKMGSNNHPETGTVNSTILLSFMILNSQKLIHVSS